MSSSPEKTLLLVAGMHRSGTSVLTHVLHLLGVTLGKELLPADAEINARGFWEHRELVELDEAALKALDHPWYDFRPLPDRWWHRQVILDLQARAVEFLNRTFTNGGIAAVKDPRLCLLLPFWERAARKAGWSPKVIMATRSPQEVAASLCRRDPMDTTTATLLWLRYTRDAEYHSRNLLRVTVDYESLLTDWPEVISRLGRSLELEWPVAEEDARPAIEETIDPSLKHQRGNREGEPLPPVSLAREIHQALVEGAKDTDRLDGYWEAFDSLLDQCDYISDSLAENSRQRFALNNRYQELGEEHARALETIQTRDRQLQDRTREWEEMGGELEYCRSVVEERDGQLQRLNKEHEELVERYHRLATQPLVRAIRKLFLRDL